MFVFFTENRLNIRLRLSLNLRLRNCLFLDINTSLNCLKTREKFLRSDRQPRITKFYMDAKGKTEKENKEKKQHEIIKNVFELYITT